MTSTVATAVAQSSEESGGGGGAHQLRRQPRWSQGETVVLVEGKLEVDGLGGRRAQGAAAKWEAVASYCRSKGVDRDAFQCRKRWGNLWCYFNKIHRSEQRRLAAGEESFWAMRADLRRERGLPGCFDVQVYNLLVAAVEAEAEAEDGAAAAAAEAEAEDEAAAEAEAEDEAAAANENQEEEEEEEEAEGGEGAAAAAKQNDGKESAEAAENNEEEEEAIDGGRAAAHDRSFTVLGIHNAAAGEDGVVVASRLGKRKDEPLSQESSDPVANDKQGNDDKETGSSAKGEKRKRDGTEDTENLIQLLIAQFEVQNGQSKEQANSLFSVLNKLADSVEKIADELHINRG